MESDSVNPYRINQGPILDALVHERFFDGESPGAVPRYSADIAPAKSLARKVQARYGISIRTGRTRVNGKDWYARYGSDPSTSTEVLAETYPLAICRLALLLSELEESRENA